MKPNSFDEKDFLPESELFEIEANPQEIRAAINDLIGVDFI